MQTKAIGIAFLTQLKTALLVFVSYVRIFFVNILYILDHDKCDAFKTKI